MSRFTRALVVKVFSSFAVAANAAPDVAGVQSALYQREVQALVETLDGYLDEHTPLERSRTPLSRVEIVGPGSSVLYDGQETRLGGTVRGLYDEDSATIYLVRPWVGDTPQDRSVLLHELYHHRQARGQHWYCTQEMEESAYRVQEDYLEAQGETLDVNWMWVALASSCAPRDHHPD